jgi:uncharacterized protein (DUF2126 family)
MSGERHVLSCNGRAIPLQPTGNVGEYVAGVRYRAWQPWSALHPTIGVHAPLTFDLVDTWMSRSLGGCQYHVSHPGGRAHEDFPVNAYAPEGRRLARFSRSAHTPGRVTVRTEQRNPDFPFTLDLAALATRKLDDQIPAACGNAFPRCWVNTNPHERDRILERDEKLFVA